ncbi:MAG: 4-hydroxybenzoate polyprenyltransferase [Granulosicoccus sp.]|jgi:4-hydroxybenzoate polyprenyltransferase
MSMETARKRITFAMHFSYSTMTAHAVKQEITDPGWTIPVALQLGRVSNLPTVWTNTLAAIVLSGQAVSLVNFIALIIAMSLAYTGGMFLNDAFDRNIDTLERPERPIPSKRIAAKEVFIAGFAMLLVTVMLVTAVGVQTSNALQAFVSSTGLCLSVVIYNIWHKGNPISPLLMGLCRLLVYICCAMALTTELNQWVLVGAFITMAYLIGLTYTAKQEQFGQVSTLWPLAFLAVPVVFGSTYHNTGSVFVLAGVFTLSIWILYCLRLILRRQHGDIPSAVVRLIAGISLVDGLLISIYLTSVEDTFAYVLLLMLLCYLAFGITLLLQRYVSGT